MWIYQKKLESPVNITTPNPRMAKALMDDYRSGKLGKLTLESPEDMQ